MFSSKLGVERLLDFILLTPELLSCRCSFSVAGWSRVLVVGCGKLSLIRLVEIGLNRVVWLGVLVGVLGCFVW